jgi:thioester reductase-like protein
VQSLLRELVASYLDRRPEEVDPATPFADYGLDSVYALTICADVEDRLGVPLDPTLMWDYPSVDLLTGALVEVLAAPGTESSSPTRSLPPSELVRQTHLPDDVRPAPGMTATPAAAGYRHLLLTGATGFAGAFLLRELLDRSTAVIHVLARARDDDEALDRVRRNLTGYGLWHEDDEPRLAAVAGDLGQEHFGLDDPRYRALTGTVEAVLHNGAAVNFVLPFARLQAVNVAGTVEILRFACQDRLKPVHLVSSMGVMPERPGIQRVPQAPMNDPQVAGGYRQTKWVAEQLVTQAAERGVPVGVYRPGNITGAQTTGAGAADTIINALIKGCIQLGSAMEFDVQLLLVPADFLAAAVVGQVLSGQGVGRFVNLPGARPLPWSELIGMLNELGYPIRMTSYPQWRQALTAQGPANSLAAYLPLFGPDAPAADLGVGGCLPEITTDSGHASLPVAPACRPVDRRLLRTYLDHLVSIGYLAPPPGAADPGPVATRPSEAAR